MPSGGLTLKPAARLRTVWKSCSLLDPTRGKEFGAARHPAIPPTGRGRGGTVYGMCKAALERFSTGLAAELYEDNIAVNALSPTQVVPTPGTLFHHLTTLDDLGNEPPSVMAEAALLLCSGDPKVLTGRIAYSQQLITELGGTIPARG